jgi:hypothetical protein
MHLQLRTIYFFSILLCFLDCTAKDVRLANPATPEEGAKQGVVAFGIYVYGDRPYSLFRDWYGYAHVLDVSLVEVTVVDNKKRRIETLPFLKTEFLKATKDSSMDFYISNYLRVTVNPIHTNEEFNIRNNLPDPINPIHAFILPDSKKEYTLESVSFQINVDNRVSKVICPLNQYDSITTLPLKPLAGKVTFLGLFRLTGTLATNEDGSCSTNTRMGFMSGNSKPILKKSDELEVTNKMKPYAEWFNLENKVEPKNAELKFLRDFIDVQKEGYWRFKAEERLAALGYKYENGFVIEVEAKKK